MGTSAQIVELAKRSGIPFGQTLRYRSTPTRRGGRSHHQDDNAVDFMGHNQDKLAAYFMGFEALEVFHYSEATGIWYGQSKGQPVDQHTHADLVQEHKNHLHVAMSPEQVKGVKPSGLLGIVSPLTNLPGPWDAGATLVDVFRPIGVLATHSIDPFFWRRIGTGLVGAALITAGVVFLVARRLQPAVQSLAGNVVSSGVSGAAFGVGAGATGGIGGGSKPVSGAPVTVPAKGPYPPRKALPSNGARGTAVLPEAYAPVSPGGTFEVTTAGGSFSKPSEYRRPTAGSLLNKATSRTGDKPVKKKKKGFS